MLCIGVLLRLYPLLTQSYIQDEMSTIAFAQAQYPLLSHFLYPLDDRPWFFYLFIKGILLFTKNPLYLRMISMLTGILSIYIVYRWALSIKKQLATLTAFTLFFSLARIDHAWQIRDHNLLLLLTSVVLFFGHVLLKKAVKQQRWNRTDITALVVCIAIGCLTNYIFIVFTIGYLLFLAAALFVLTKKWRIVTTFCLQITIQLLPLAGLLAWYLFGQADTKDILVSTSWIPHETAFTFLSINSTMLGLTTYFNEFYQPTAEAFNEVLSLNIGILLFFLLTGIMLVKKKFKNASPVLAVYFFGGLFIYAFSYIAVLAISKLLHIHMMLPRTFIRSGTMFLLSFNIGIYVWFTNMIKARYQKVIRLFVVLLFLLLFLRNFLTYYQIPSDRPHLNPRGDIIDVIDRYYRSGDQIVFFPIHYQFLYIPFYYEHNAVYTRSSKLAYQKMQQFNLEDPVLRKTLSKYSGKTFMDNRFNGKILFVEERTIFSATPQGLPDTYVVKNEFLYGEIKKYCAEDPIWIDESSNFILRACWFKEEYQF